MIKTFAELLESLKEKELALLEKYGIIAHGPMIGGMYEGFTKTILHKCVFQSLDLRVVSGKIRGAAEEFSRQIDCMVVTGEPERIPYTDDFICDSSQVIAVVEVKKNLYSSELQDAYENLRSVWTVHQPKSLETRQLRDAFKSICSKDLPEHTEVGRLPFHEEMIYHSLVMEASLPIRIVLGYYGFKSEANLRRAFIEYLEPHISLPDEKVKGFGPVSFPNLIISGQNSLLKVNGMPYGNPLKNNGLWPIYVSSSHNPSLLLLELLWSRLTYTYQWLSDDVFGEDLESEIFNPLLEGKAVSREGGAGWEYSYVDLDDKHLATHSGLHFSWEPAVLNETCFIAANWLCTHGKIDLIEEGFLGFLTTQGYEFDQFVTDMCDSGLVYVAAESNTMRLLTDQCATVAMPDGRLVAGENKSGRLWRWVQRNS